MLEPSCGQSQRRRGKVKAGRCTSVSVVPSGRVAFFGWDQLRDSKSGACLTMSELLDGPQTAAPKTADLPLESPGIVVCGSLSPDGTRLATLKVAANAESTVSVWELDKSFAAGGSPGERDIELGMAAAAVPPLLQSQRLLWWGFGLLLPLTALVLWTCVGAFAAAALVAALPALAIEFVKGLWSEKGYFVGTCTGLGYLTLALVALPFLAVAAVLALGLVAVAGPLYAMYQVTKSPYLLVYIPFVLPYQLTRARLQASALRQYRLKNVPSIVKIVYPVLVSSRASAEAPPANPDDAVATRIDDGKWSDEHLRQLAAMMTMPKELTLSGTQCQVAPTDVETTPFKNSFAVFASLGAPVRLIRAQYLVDLWERGAVMQMRQNLPYYAFYDSGPFDTGTHVIVVSCASECPRTTALGATIPCPQTAHEPTAPFPVHTRVLSSFPLCSGRAWQTRGSPAIIRTRLASMSTFSARCSSPSWRPTAIAPPSSLSEWLSRPPRATLCFPPGFPPTHSLRRTHSSLFSLVAAPSQLDVALPEQARGLALRQAECALRHRARHHDALVRPPAYARLVPHKATNGPSPLRGRPHRHVV